MSSVKVITLALLTLVAACTSGQRPLAKDVAIGSGLDLSTVKQLSLERLSEFGVLPPSATDHRRGKGLILMAIGATSFFKGNWVQAHGLLGTSMLECTVLDCIAYRSLFGVDRSGISGKMSETLILDNALLLSPNNEPATGRSIILRREAVIYATSWHIRSRFIFDNAGNYGRHYAPEPYRKSNLQLIKDLEVALSVHRELRNNGFRDETLETILGTAYAVLVFDKVQIPDVASVHGVIAAGQRHVDALNAVLVYMKSLPNDHAEHFLEEFERELRARDLKIDDGMLLPEHSEQRLALLDILDVDLDVVRQASKTEYN